MSTYLPTHPTGYVMRLRSAFTAAATALVLVLSTAGSSTAADGQFVYNSGNPNDAKLFHVITNPENGVCYDLTGGTGTFAALHGVNATDAQATLFPDAECEDRFIRWVLMPGEHSRDESFARFRSVKFS
ncbi:hypothetical protein [Streptomyces hydrogenans]|uniref:hypothetical protein n=1 Tax=Streptomyces hydrogenans TaxID=1873719 RepID=UPI003432E8ED